MEKLPAGLLPDDNNIEFFADPKQFGKCFWIKNGQTKLFREMPLSVLDDLRDELLSDSNASNGLRLMGITEPGEMLEHYVFCNYGMCDGTPDILVNGKRNREYFNCGRKGKCFGENKVCSPLTINGERISHREYDYMKCASSGITTCEELIPALGFRSFTAVNSLAKRVREKLNCKNTAEVVYKIKEFRLV